VADEKTTFEIALRDSISPALRSIARSLKELNETSQQRQQVAANNVGRFDRGIYNFGATARQATKDLAGMGSWFVGAAGGILGGLATVETVKKISEAFSEMATSRVHLTMFSRDTRFAADDIEKLRAAMGRMAIKADQADTLIGGLGAKLQELQAFKEGSPLFQELAKMGQKGVDLANELVNEKDYMKSLHRIIDVFKNASPEAQSNMVRVFGIPASVLENLEKNLAKVKNLPPPLDPAVAQRYLDNQEAFRSKIDDEWKRFGGHLLEKINEFNDSLDDSEGVGWSRFANSFFDAVDVRIDQDFKDVQKLIKAYETLKTVYEERLKPTDVRQSLQDAIDKASGRGNRWDQSFGAFEERQKLIEDSNNSLSKINEIFKKKALEREGVAGSGGGSGAGGGGGGGGGGDDAYAPATSRGRGQMPRNMKDGVSTSGRATETEGEKAASTGTPTASNPVADQAAKAANPQAAGEFPPAETAVGGGAPAAFIAHHTGGRGDIAGVQSTLRARGLGVEYIMDREGNIVHSGGPGSSQMMTGWGKYGAGLSNRNTVGMEIIAKSDKDVLPIQAQRFAEFMAKRYPNTPIYGHGEVNPGHKEADEGLTAKRAALEYRAAHGGGGDAEEARNNIDKDEGSVFKKGSNAIKFSFNNVPSGVKTNAEASGSFTQVEVSRKSASEQRAPD
jgi:hypothetical protein